MLSSSKGFLIKRTSAFRIFFLGFILQLTYFVKGSSFDSDTVILYASICSVFFVVISIRAFRTNIMFLIISLCLLLFHFGQVWLMCFGVEIGEMYIATYAKLYQTTNFYEAIIYSIFVSCSVIIGGLLVNDNYELNYSEDLYYDNKRTDCNGNEPVIAMRFTSLFWLIFAIITAFTLYRDVLQALSVMSSGYLGAFAYDVGILARMSYFFNFASIALLMLLDGKSKTRVFVFLVARQLFIMFAVGRRMDAITFIIIYSVLLIRNSETAKRRKVYFTLGVIIVLLLFAVPFITYSRTNITELGFISFSTKNNPIVLILEEFGGTLSTVTLSVNYTLSHGFKWGGQYLGCILGIIPLSSRLFPSLTAGTAFASTLNNAYFINGLGGSSIAELYWNFGGSLVLTIIIAVIFGYVVGKITIKYRTKTSILSSIFYVYIYAYLLQMIRDSVYGLVSALSNGLIVLLICYFFKQYLVYYRD